MGLLVRSPRLRQVMYCVADLCNGTDDVPAAVSSYNSRYQIKWPVG